MAKVGLKDTLALIAKGYTKKEIDELAALDDQIQQEAEQKTEEPAKNEKQETVTEEPKITQEYIDQMQKLQDQIKANEEKLTKLQQEKEKAEAKVTKLQQDNIHRDSSGDAEALKEKETESLFNMVRSYM